jgi:hypothetical protein
MEPGWNPPASACSFVAVLAPVGSSTRRGVRWVASRRSLRLHPQKGPMPAPVRSVNAARVLHKETQLRASAFPLPPSLTPPRDSVLQATPWQRGRGEGRGAGADHRGESLPVAMMTSRPAKAKAGEARLLLAGREIHWAASGLLRRFTQMGKGFQGLPVPPTLPASEPRRGGVTR